MRGFRTRSLSRFAAGLLCGTALPLLATTALAATFNVGGGTINTTQADNSSDNTGTGGGFALQPNTTGSNDVIAISGVVINNTSGAPSGRALDLGYTLSSSGPYSITMQGSNLTATPGSGMAAFIASSAGGNISFDSTGGAANTVSGPIGINLNANGGNVSIRTGADTVTTSGLTGEILYATTTGAGTIAIDSSGATLTNSSGIYGISAVTGGSGAITIGGLNGGISSNITVNGGYGIYVTSVSSTIDVAIASAGAITAINGMRLQGGVTTVDNFGTINASNNAIDASSVSQLTANLQSSSVTTGIIAGGSGNDSFAIFGGANITGATFNGAGGADTLNLSGSGNGSFALSKASNIEAFQKTGSGTWTLIGTTASVTPWTVSGGTLSISDGASLGDSSGILTLNGGALKVTAGPVISDRSLVLGVGGGTLSITGPSFQQDGVISGSGGLTVAAGTVVLNATNTYTGGTTILSGGRLTLGAGGTSGSVAGNIVNNGTLVFNRSDTVIFAGNISGTGGLSKMAPGSGSGTLILTGDNSYTGTTQFLGTLQIGNGGTTGSIAGNVNNQGTLIFNRSDDVTFGGASSGSGGMIKRGAGTLTLTGSNAITGIFNVEEGTLRLGSSAMGFGSINTTNSAIEYLDGINIRNRISLGGASTRLQVGAGAAATQSGSISGSAQLEKTGQGVLTLAAANGYSGATTVSAGTLSITGALNNSNTTVANGANLTGTGSVRNVTVASGGAVGPAGTGTLTVQGNLALSAGANYTDSITPTTAGLTNVSGAANLNGTAAISAGAGNYTAGQRYTLISAAGGVSGTFSVLSISNLPGYVKGRLDYDANNAYLYLDPNAISPLLPSGASLNQASVAAGIDAALQRGATLNSGFAALFNLQGAALGNALNQIAGQGAPNIATAGGQSLTPFLSVMQGQGGFGGNAPDTAANFAPGSVYGAADAPRRAQLAPGAMRVWGSVYGGHAGISADAATGAASLSASNVGFIAGAEVSLTDDFRLGASAGFGSQDFSSANSTGDSDDVMLGLYARQDILENGYISAAFAYSWHGISAARTITVAGTDVLGARFNAHAIGGRIEGGWRLALDEALGLTPFFAFAGDNFYAPAYAESVISGSSSFALSYAANKTGQKHTEFGAHFDHALDLGGGDMLSADARAAWAHQLDDAPFVTAAFQGLPGSTFRLLGVRAATDTALLGLGLKIRNPNGLDVGLRMDSQVGAGTTVLQGMGTISWRW